MDLTELLMSKGRDYFKGYRRDIRAERMDSLVPDDKRCPLCGSMRLSSRSWVLKPRRRNFKSKEAEKQYEDRLNQWNSLQLPKAVCRSCYSKIRNGLIKSKKQRYFVWNGELLACRIEASGLSKADFARHSGYSESYIRELLMRLSFRTDEKTHRDFMQTLCDLQIPVSDLIKYQFESDNSEGVRNATRLRLRDGHFELE